MNNNINGKNSKTVHYKIPVSVFGMKEIYFVAALCLLEDAGTSHL
jgi:hypothetical protein